MSGRKSLPWANEEVQTFLYIVGDDAVQRELNGAVRNEKVFTMVSQRMADAGYMKTTEQCRLKCKKLRIEYRKIKDSHSQGGGGLHGKQWKWFDMMDAIYGHRPEFIMKGRAGEMDNTSAHCGEAIEEPQPTESSGTSTIRRVALHPRLNRFRYETHKRKADSDATKEFLSAMTDCHMQWLEKEREQRREEWHMEATLRREEMKQEAALRREEAEREERLRRDEMEARSKDMALLTSCLTQIARLIAKDPAAL